MALSWVLRLPQVSSAVIGATRIEQLHENIKATSMVLSDKVLHHINEIRADLLLNGGLSYNDGATHVA